MSGASKSEFKIGIKQIVNEIQQLALILLRFLYSVQRNRKLFRLVFPPEIFGPFIDIGNYERNREKYKLIKKIHRLPENSRDAIMANFEKIRDISSGVAENQKIVNGYTIIDIIGKGAFGIVYEVEKEGMRYAMKKIDVSQYDHTFEHIKQEDIEEDKKDLDVQVSDKIVKEISILKGVDHPNIIKFYTSFVENDSVYIIMELHEGLSLSDYIQSLSEKRQKIKEETAWNIFFQCCSALRYLHYDMKILHRDFAPSNILIDENFTVKLIDFGLATRWGTQSASGNKSFVGTILYSCPEMVQNKKCTVKADVWSLGAIMYELLTLQQPFKGDNPLLIANKIVKCI
jgi:NIMA (never in mitosis gene a)-related kinase 10